MATDREDDRDGPGRDNEGKHCVTIAAGSNLFTCGLIDGSETAGTAELPRVGRTPAESPVHIGGIAVIGGSGFLVTLGEGAVPRP